VTSPPVQTELARLLVTTEQAAQVLSVGRTTVWELIRVGEIAVIHIGRSCRISYGELQRYVRALESGQDEESTIDGERQESQ
jgi:excisionase family DNA binding protein